MLEENAKAVASGIQTFGQNGELTLNIRLLPQDFNPSGTVVCRHRQMAVPLLRPFQRGRGRSGAVVAFGDIDTERRGRTDRARTLPEPRTDEEDDEGDGLIYLEDLVGYTVKVDRRKIRYAC